MKRPYSAFVLLVAASAHAQFAPVALPLHQLDKHAPGHPARLAPMPEEARGVAFYTETFDNDLNGWTVVTGTGQVHWKWTNVGPGPTTSIYPVPPLNTSTPSGWAIIDDDFDGVSGASTNSALISPVIDLSSVGTPFLKVEFEQYFQEFQLDTTWLGVSTNGGLNWTEVLINEEVGRDGRPNPEVVDVNISALVVGNPANVQLRFRYKATWDYGWQIDNIVIRELPANDMAILRASSTAFDFANTGFGFMDYSIYPQSQVNSMTPGAVLKNKGYQTQNNVILSVGVNGPSGSELTANSPAFQYTPGSEGDVNAETFTPSGLIGDYAMTFTVQQNETDEIPENNVIVNSFKVSPNVYAHDDGSTQSFIGPAVDNESQPYEVGHHFALVADNQLVAVQVAVHDNTPVGTTVHGALYNPSTTAGVHPGLIEFTNDHVVTEADLNGSGEANFITMAFDTPINLIAGQAYLLMAGSFDGGNGLRFAYSGVSEAQISIIHYPDLIDDFEFYMTRTPMVRMVIAGNVGIAEDATPGHHLGVNIPNPFSTGTVIPFELKSSDRVSIQVSDVSGKVVLTNDLGSLPAGQHRFELDGATLAPGLYTYTLNSSLGRNARRMVVAR